MAEIIVSSSSDRDDREIDEYHDDSNSSGSSSESSSSDERYLFGTLKIPLEVFQEEMRKRVAHLGISTKFLRMSTFIFLLLVNGVVFQIPLELVYTKPTF